MTNTMTITRTNNIKSFRNLAIHEFERFQCDNNKLAIMQLASKIEALWSKYYRAQSPKAIYYMSPEDIVCERASLNEYRRDIKRLSGLMRERGYDYRSLTVGFHMIYHGSHWRSLLRDEYKSLEEETRKAEITSQCAGEV